MTKISTPTRYYRYNARGSEGNDQVIRVAANLLKKVTGTNITVVKEMPVIITSHTISLVLPLL